jgi:NAD binding domain of 6-phosphogluconate dehydrogenase
MPLDEKPFRSDEEPAAGRIGPQETADMAKIGFLGIGEMGAPMASRLLQAGHDVATIVGEEPSADRRPLNKSDHD